MPSNAGLCRRVKEFIETHFARICSVAEVAEQFEVSPAWLARTFRNAYGLGPKEYLDAIRIREAMKLLAKKRMRCYEIAQAVGLKDEDALGKLFKRQDMPSPSVINGKAKKKIIEESHSYK